MTHQLQILALLSDPLVDERGRPVARLGLEREVARVCAQLSSLNRSAVLRLVIATPDNLLNALREGPFDVLHFSGHGGDDELAFEDGCGGVLATDTLRLRAVLTARGEAPCQVAFLSACHSASVAGALLDAGVPHVVAVDVKHSILDPAARAFAAHFFPDLLAGNSVRQAFSAGRAAALNDVDTRRAIGAWVEEARQDPQLAVQLSQMQANGLSPVVILQQMEMLKFQLLPAADPGAPDPHETIPFPDVPVGGLEVQALPEPPAMLGATPEFFTGREADLHDTINQVLEHRLTTVVGGGGIGKSELAREAGRWFARRGLFPGGIFFVPLDNAASAAEARLALAATMGLQPALAGDDRSLAGALPAGSLLILDELDNLCGQQVLRATRELFKALSEAGHARVLATSRQATGAAGEQRFELRRLTRTAAERLFIEIARGQVGGVHGSRAELDAILDFLDGVPRAIHLAARQMSTPDLSALVADLRRAREYILRDPDLPEGELRDHESVLVTLESSFRRLEERDPRAAAFFPCLALFPAGLGDAGIVEIFGAEAHRLVRAVRDLSLLEVSPPLDYYYLPAPVRSYAERKLAPVRDALMSSIGENALAYYARVAKALNGLITSGRLEDGIALTWLELPNLHLWLDWGYGAETTHGDGACQTARIMAALSNFYVFVHALRQEADDRYRCALESARRLQDRRGEANCIKGLGDVHLMLNQYPQARARYEEALPLYDAVADAVGKANCVQSLADAYLPSDPRMAGARYEEALSIYRAIPAKLGEANCVTRLGDIHSALGQYPQARVRYEEALPMYRSIGDKLGEAKCIKGLGGVHASMAEYPQARARYEEALLVFRAVDDKLNEANCILSLGNVHRMMAEYTQARARYEEALPIYRAIGAKLGEANCIQDLGNVHRMMAEYTQARARYEEALSIYRAIGAKLGEANCITALGDVHMRLAEYPQARARAEEALSIRRAIGDKLGEANCIEAFGDMLLMLDEYPQARARYEEAMSIYRAVGNKLGEANCVKALGDVHIHLAEYPQARARYQEAMPIYRSIGDRVGEANAHRGMGDSCDRLDQLEEAVDHYNTCLAMYQQIGDRYNAGRAVVLSVAPFYIRHGQPQAAFQAYAKVLLIALTMEPQFFVAFAGSALQEACALARANPEQAAAGCAVLFGDLDPALEQARRDRNEQRSSLLSVALAAFQVIGLVCAVLTASDLERRPALEQARRQAAQVDECTNAAFALVTWLDEATAALPPASSAT